MFFWTNHERASTLTLIPTLIQANAKAKAKAKAKAATRAWLRRAFWII